MCMLLIILGIIFILLAFTSKKGCFLVYNLSAYYVAAMSYVQNEPLRENFKMQPQLPPCPQIDQQNS